MKAILKNYNSIILLLIGITVGSLIGLLFPDWVTYIKPIGDIFLNLLFVTMFPFHLFTIAIVIANLKSINKLGKILGVISFAFISSIVIAAVLTIAGLWVFP